MRICLLIRRVLWAQYKHPKEKIWKQVRKRFYEEEVTGVVWWHLLGCVLVFALWNFLGG